ncbi:MAG: hypothetical protein N2110_00740 [Flavobacteriales bacterium]|nr:hypothetical protein [Flavobacteriales bacterium]MCX7767537.1 hypothetical protein [Flavobacteriales bacterium]MDW8410390.1 hypothetical protein [Flavobacteriales bacterium]
MKLPAITSRIFLTDIVVPALSSTAFLALNVPLHGLPWYQDYASFLFCAVIGVYGGQRMIRALRKELPEPRRSFYLRRAYVFTILITISFGSAIYFMIRLPAPVPWILIALGLVSVGYVWNPFSVKAALRYLPYVKSPVAALVWSASTALIPGIMTRMPFPELAGMTFARFLFALALILPFDEMHLEEDIKEGIQSVPGLLGKNGLLVIYVIIWLLYVIIISLFLQSGFIKTILCHTWISLFFGINYFLPMECRWSLDTLPFWAFTNIHFVDILLK